MASANALINNQASGEQFGRSFSADSAIFDAVEVEDSPDEVEDDEVEDDVEYERDDSEQGNFEKLEQKSSKILRRSAPRIVQFGSKRNPLIHFSPKVVYQRSLEAEQIGEKFSLTFKFIKNETKLIRNILEGHGFREVHPSSSEFNVLWTGGGMKPFTLRSLQPFQRVNHFPRSYEMTRKDRLYKNVQKMQQEKGLKNFNFIPTTFLLPYEFEDFSAAFQREKGLWIIKPVASSQGKGIFLINHPDQVPLDENLVISRYIDNPLLIDGYKFDVRIYVAVTSYDPLVAYLYEEGLTRFATVKYDPNSRSIKNAFMHLTNYSVNKRSHRYVRCDDADIEDFGNKWSMSAMLRLLQSEGKDTFTLMMSIEDVIIKTLLSVESQISAACRMFVPTRGNCFEVYGFDILIDDELKPWVLEVNLSPSLACDAPLDLKIKSSMICDLLNLCSFPCVDPSIYSNKQKQHRIESASSGDQLKKRRPISAGYGLSGNSSGPSFNTNTNMNTTMMRSRTATQQRPTSKSRQSNQFDAGNQESPIHGIYFGLSSEEIRILRTIKEEHRSKGGFVRIFPTADTFEFFSSFFEQRTTTYNQMIHQRLYPSRWTQSALNSQLHSVQTTIRRTTIPRFKHLSAAYHSFQSNDKDKISMTKTNGVDLQQALQRYQIYQRRLEDPQMNQEQGQINSHAKVKLSANDQPQNLSQSIDENLSSKSSSNHHRIATQIQLSDLTKSQNGPLKILSSKRTNSAHASNDHSIKDQIREKTSIQMNSSSDDNRHSIYSKNELMQQINQGLTLSPYQARVAFATYLQRIQIRLMLDSELKEEITSTQHMELVLRFLKRAGQNLSPIFRVEIPSRRLSIADQKRILAKQLADFLHLYQKETASIHSNQTSSNSVDQKLFENFLRSASESDLEQMMTNYMKTNPNSSIHLGVHPKSNKNSSISSISNNSASTNPSTTSTLITMKTIEQDTTDSHDHDQMATATRSSSANNSSSITIVQKFSSNDSTASSSTTKPMLRTSSASRHRNSQQKRQEDIYRLYGISRPLSAVVQHRKQLTATVPNASSGQTNKSLIKQRPNSANLPGEQQEANREFVEQLNELSSKQHRRQYSGLHHLNVIHDRSLSSSLDPTIITSATMSNQNPSTTKDQLTTATREEEILEKSRQMLEESQAKNEQLAEQAKLFQRTLQRNEIYSALNRFSHRPPIYPTTVFKENKTLSNRFQSLRNQSNVSLFNDQHRFKSSTSSSQTQDDQKLNT